MKWIVETKRLRLREYAETDAEAFYRLNSDPAVMRFVGETLVESVEQARAIIRAYPIVDYATYGFGRWACVLRESEEVIGFAGFKFLPETGEVDLGYRLLPAYWDRGLATEACVAVIPYGFERLQLSEITALVLPENGASARVLEKCGFVRTGIVDYRGLRPARYLMKAARPSFRGDV